MDRERYDAPWRPRRIEKRGHRPRRFPDAARGYRSKLKLAFALCRDLLQVDPGSCEKAPRHGIRRAGWRPARLVAHSMELRSSDCVAGPPDRPLAVRGTLRCGPRWIPAWSERAHLHP